MIFGKSKTIDRPVLTFPEDVAAWVTDVYGRAETILEYGSGGSTILAAEQPGKTIFSVESDKGWADNIQAYLDANPPKSDVHLHYADVGPTKKWGFPENQAKRGDFPLYALGVWDLPDFKHPDVVLVDGRFRVACFLATLFRVTKPVTLYFDDYLNRPKYHVVETFVPRVETRGRMARFDIAPQTIPAARLAEIITYMQTPA